MQKRIFKTITILCLIALFSLCFFSNITLATEDEVIANSVTNETNSTDTTSNEVTDEDESHQEDVYSTSPEETDLEANEVSKTSNTVTTNNQTQRINSYSTVSTLPEANLGLNNILNVILIAIGIIIILLAIAILIKLK